MPLTKLGAGPSAGYTGVCISDTFTDDNGTALPDHTPNTDAVGNGWQAGTGTWTITGNKAYMSSGGVAVDNVLIDAGLADLTLVCDVSTSTDLLMGVCVRASATDSSLEIYLYPGDGKIYLVKNDSGSRSTLTSAATGASINTTYEFKVVLLGTSIVVSVDDIERINTTDSFNQSETIVGLWSWANYNGARWDNLLVEA